jgi:hypothetical protein
MWNGPSFDPHSERGDFMNYVMTLTVLTFIVNRDCFVPEKARLTPFQGKRLEAAINERRRRHPHVV